MEDDNRGNKPPFAEERKAAQDFIENINEARRELTIKEPELAKQKIIMARNLLPLISRVKPSESRLTRVEFGGGLYADDLSQRKSYSPIETQSLENLTRSGGPRWVKNTRAESDAKIIYVTLNLKDGEARAYLERAEKYILAGNTKDAEVQLAEMSDRVIRIDDHVPTVVQARDYIRLAENYISVSNFFGARHCLERTNELLEKMKTEDTYKAHRAGIISLYGDIRNLQTAFAQLDADQIKTAGESLRKWGGTLSSWANE